MAKKTGTAVQVNTAAGGRSFWKQLRKQKTLVLMALLPVIMVIIFKYIPMYGILIAFKNYKSAKGVWGSKSVSYTHLWGRRWCGLDSKTAVTLRRAGQPALIMRKWRSWRP